MTRLEQIKARWAKATKGPWVSIAAVKHSHNYQTPLKIKGEQGSHRTQALGRMTIATMGAGGDAGSETMRIRDANGEAIAAAPEDIAWLVARVEELEAYGRAKNDLVEQLVREVDALKGGGNG